MTHRRPAWLRRLAQLWATAGRPVWAGTVILGLLALAALVVQVISLASPGMRGWAATVAWALAGLVACAAATAAGLRVHVRKVTRDSWLLWGLGAGCWTIGALIQSWLPAGHGGLAAEVWFLGFPLLCIYTYFLRLPRPFLFVLFLLDAIPVVLLVLALSLQFGTNPHGPVFASIFTGLYVLMAANAIQMLGIHLDLRHIPRTWLFTLAFCTMAFAALAGPPHAGGGGSTLVRWVGAVWTVSLFLLAAAALGRILEPRGLVTLLPTEKQTGPHAIPPTAAVFGLIALLFVTPHPSAVLRSFLLSAALVLLIRIFLVYRQDVRLIAEVVGSRERLRLLAEATSRLKSLILDELLETFCLAAREVLGVPYAAVGVAGEGEGFTHLVSSCSAGPGGEGGGGEAAGGEAAGGEAAGGEAAGGEAAGGEAAGGEAAGGKAAGGEAAGGSGGAAAWPPAGRVQPGRPVRLTRPTRDPAAAGFRPGQPPGGSFLGVPVAVGTEGHGALYLAGKEGGFTAEDENLAELLAASCGSAVVNARLYAESRAQQELLAAQNEQLRELDRLKDEFIALVSHELRTPLTSIIGYVELLRDEDVSAPGTGYLQFAEAIDRNAHRLLRMVGDLLFLSRIQAGRMKMEMTSTDLGEIAASAVSEAQPRAREQHIRLTLTAGPLPPFPCDPERIAQVLDNLIGNALKFTPGGGQVEVRCGPGGEGAVLEVADSGIGISPADQERVFETFFRSQAAVKQAIPGTGLGLAITKAIVDAHHGTITVESGEGRGTTFRVWIPLHPAPAGPSADRAAGAGAVAPGN